MKIIFRIFLILISIELGIRFVGFTYNTYNLFFKKYNESVNSKAFRIICIGESTVEGEDTINKKTETFPVQLEKMLKNKFKNKNIQVFNLGVSGVSQIQIYKNLKYNLRYFSPNLIIYLSGFNHEMPAPLFKSLFKHPGGGYNLALWINSFKVVRFVTTVKYLLNSKDYSFKILYNKIYKQYVKHQGYWNENIAKTYVEKSVNLMHEGNYKVLICNYFDAYINNWLKGLAQKYKYPFCDNEKIFTKYKNDNKEHEIITKDGWHPNAKGYYLMAQNIYKEIIDEKLIAEE